MPEDMGAVGLAEAPAAETGAETVETGADAGTDGAVASEVSNEVDSPESKEVLTDKVQSKGKLNLADVVKKSGDALKAINPALPAALRTAAFEQAGLYREFPGGLKEAVALKSEIGGLGGVEGIKETAQAYAEVGAIAQKFFDGKPEFWDDLIAESPASLSQIMPAGLEKWKTSDAETYNHVQSKVFTQTVDQIGLSKSLESLYAIAEGQAKEEIARLWNALDAVRKTGEKAPERKVNPQEQQLSEREQKLAQREIQLSMRPVESAGKAQVTEILDREMMQGYQWDKTDQDVKDAVREHTESEMAKALGKDTGYIKERDRLKARGDFEGLTRHIKNTQARLMPNIVQRVAKLFAVKPKGAGPVAVKKAAPVAANGVVAKQEQGWTKWNEQAPPNAKLIDRSKTSADMILGNPSKYVLKDGRRVVWG